MTAQAGKKQSALTGPLDRLSDMLAGDMKAVNAEIIRRMDSPVELIPRLAAYLIAAGGKRIRPLMTLASTSIFNGDMKRAHNLAAAVEFIHTATLLHDDVVDESIARRGQDSANLVFGNQASVLVGDFLFSRAFQLMVDDGSLEVLKILSGASAIIAQGEVMQLSTTNNLSTGMGEYLEVIRAKTAALFAAACEVGPIIAGADKSAATAMAEYGLNLGIAFQITDDALDYASTKDKIGKTPGDDFREGKMTAPVILALMKSSPEEMKFWARTLGEKQQSPKDFAEAQHIIKSHDSIAGSLALAGDYGEKARLALAEAPDHPMRALLDELIPYTIGRES
ncbi:MAG: polyprenyl synthetase family protein [Alphaproteobacteria bacterium]